MRCGNKRGLRVKIFRILALTFFCFSSALSVACQSKSKDAAAALQPCQVMVNKQDIVAAGECYNAVLAANPQFANELEELFAKSVFDKCLEIKSKKDYKQAIICLEAVSALADDSANVQLHLAESYYQFSKNFKHSEKDFLDRAETAIKKSLEINPEKPIAYETYGEILERKGEPRKALEKYRKAVDLAPKDEIYWMKLALTQEKLKDVSSALISYYQVLQINPKAALALYNSAKLYEQIGNIEQAIKNFEKLLEIEGSFDDAEERLETLKKQKNQPKEKTKSPEVYRGVGNSGKFP